MATDPQSPVLPVRFIDHTEVAFPELSAESPNTLFGKSVEVVVVDGGMSSGRPSIVIRTDAFGGEVMLTETSARLLVVAAKAIEARYPGLFDD